MSKKRPGLKGLERDLYDMLVQNHISYTNTAAMLCARSKAGGIAIPRIVEITKMVLDDCSESIRAIYEKVVIERQRERKEHN